MPAPIPTPSAVQAREAVRGHARSVIARGYHLDARSIDETAGAGAERVEQILGTDLPPDAGWALLFTGVILMRGDDDRSIARAVTSDEMTSAGMSFGAFLSAAAGDQLLARGERPKRDEATVSAGGSRWRPPEGGEAVVDEAGARSREVVVAAVTEPAASRLAEALVARLREEIVGLDVTVAGWALSVFGAWLSAAAPQASRAVGRSRVLGRPNPRARTGCELGGAVLTFTGSTLLADVAPPTH